MEVIVSFALENTHNEIDNYKFFTCGDNTREKEVLTDYGLKISQN